MEEIKILKNQRSYSGIGPSSEISKILMVFHINQDWKFNSKITKLLTSSFGDFFQCGAGSIATFYICREILQEEQKPQGEMVRAAV